MHLTETRLIPSAEFGIKEPLGRRLVSRRELSDGNLTHAPRLPSRTASSHVFLQRVATEMIL